MRKLNILLCLSTAVLVGILSFGSTSISESPKSEVRLTSEPNSAQIIPFEAESAKHSSPIKFILQAVDKGGIPLTSAKMHLQIFAPSPTPWFSTDFPIVEGTKLLDLEMIAPKGEIQIQQMLPIRGEYKLAIDVLPLIDNSFIPFQQNLKFSVSESPIKYQNFWFLVSILVIVGLMGGWIIGGKQQLQSGEVAPQPVRSLLSVFAVAAIAALLFINVNAEVSNSQMSMADIHEHVKQSSSGFSQSQGLKLTLSGDKSATVGKVANLQASLTNIKTGEPVNNVSFVLKTTQLENNWVAFAANTPVVNGQLTWQQGFFDGAPHKVEVEVLPQANASPQFQAFTVTEDIEVEGVAPPLVVRLITLGYLTGIVTIALVTAMILKQRLVS